MRTMSPVPCATSRLDTKKIDFPSGVQARIDRVIERTVVVARHGALPVGNERASLRQPAVAKLRGVEKEVAGARGGDPGEAHSIWRPTGLDVDRAARSERRHRSGGEVEQHQL